MSTNRQRQYRIDRDVVLFNRDFLADVAGPGNAKTGTVELAQQTIIISPSIPQPVPLRIQGKGWHQYEIQLLGIQTFEGVSGFINSVGALSDPVGQVGQDFKPFSFLDTGSKKLYGRFQPEEGAQIGLVREAQKDQHSFGPDSANQNSGPKTNQIGQMFSGPSGKPLAAF